MAKLNAKNRKKVAKAEATTGFKPLPPGKYLAHLRSVVAKDSGAGNPMWAIEFDKIYNSEGEKQPGRQFYNLMLPQDSMPDNYTKGEEKWDQFQALSAGRIKAFLEAFGGDEDTDTDDLIGQKVGIRLGIGTIQAGNRKGEQTNRIEEVFAPDDLGDIEVDDDDDDNF